MRFKTKLGSRKCFLIKDLLVLQEPIRVKRHLPSPMREKVVSLMLIGLFFLNVVEGIMASFLWARVISIIVERFVI